MRRAGKAPGIVYGGTAKPTPIELDHNALFHALRNEAFHSSILTMKLDGAATKVLLRDVQMHPFRNEILHVDFQRIEENRKIHMKVPLHFVNGEQSPAVKLSAAIISHVTTELDITCLPKDLPEFIEVDLSALEVGHSIHVSSAEAAAGRGGRDPRQDRSGRRGGHRAARAGRNGRGTAATAEAAAAAAAAVPEGEAKAADDKGGDKKDERKTPRRTTRRSNRRRGRIAEAGPRNLRGPFCCAAGFARTFAKHEHEHAHSTRRRPRQPGSRIWRTRHNAGFWFVDELAGRLDATFATEAKFGGEVAKAGDLAPGEADDLHEPVRARGCGGGAFFRNPPAEILVVHDELDLLPGKAKMKFGGGHAGHNGLRDIQAQLCQVRD